MHEKDDSGIAVEYYGSAVLHFSRLSLSLSTSFIPLTLMSPLARISPLVPGYAIYTFTSVNFCQPEPGRRSARTFVHWHVANIPQIDLEKGDVVLAYIPRSDVAAH